MRLPSIGNPLRLVTTPMGWVGKKMAATPGRIWEMANKPIPGTMWVDNMMKGGAKKAGKVALIGAAVAGGVYAAGSIVSSMRNRREYKAPERPDADPYAGMDTMTPAYAMEGPDTLMGMPMVEGAHAQRVKAARGGMAAGVDASAPELERDGRSTVDGRPVQDLGGVGF